MDKKIEDYLHLYLGCECMVVNHFKSTVIGIHTNGNIQVAHAKSNQTFWEAKYIKPLLRKLSDMSEEESHDLENAMWGNWQDPQVGDKESVLKMFINDSSQDRLGYEITVKATNWFRKNSFDVDGLIEAGLAIDKTKQ